MLTKKNPVLKEEATKQEAAAAPKITRKSPALPGAGGSTTNQAAASKVVIKYDVGFNNHLFIRGKGANLSWHKGIPLQNKSADEWTWQTDVPFQDLEFKILINDEHYEEGDNHRLKQGQTVHYVPRFS